jgi:DNA polymerase III delta prime subunit
MVDRIKYICTQENVPFSEEMAKTLAEVSEGDLRKAINYLQNAFALYGQELDASSITEVAGVCSYIVQTYLS